MNGTPEIVMASIPHTGTNFTLRLFKEMGYLDMTTNDKRQPGCVYHAHTHKPNLVESVLKLVNEMPLVIPLRHPFVVEESWKRRTKPIDEMIRNFKLLETFMTYDPYFLPVDSERREDALQAMRDGLNIPFETEWPIRNSACGTGDYRFEDMQPSPEVTALAEDMDWLLDRWY